MTARGAPFLLGDAVSYVDLGLFQLLAGLQCAFPSAIKTALANKPLLIGLQQQLTEHPKLKPYLNSYRLMPFNEDGIFRYYPALDLGADA